jgi:hypothetical protein
MSRVQFQWLREAVTRPVELRPAVLMYAQALSHNGHRRILVGSPPRQLVVLRRADPSARRRSPERPHRLRALPEPRSDLHLPNSLERMRLPKLAEVAHLPLEAAQLFRRAH